MHLQQRARKVLLKPHNKLHRGYLDHVMCSGREEFFDIIGQHPSVSKSNWLIRVDNYHSLFINWGLFYKFLKKDRSFSRSLELQPVNSQTQPVHV